MRYLPRVVFIAVVVLMGTIAGAAQPDAKAGGAGAPVSGGTEILNGRSYFRWRRVTAPITFADAQGPCQAPADFSKIKPPLSSDPEDVPPPATWTGVEFDDSTWPRAQLGGEAITDGEAVFLGGFAVCLRGRFEVTDPAAVHSLVIPELRFMGGIVVYLNGREIARNSLGDGKIEATTAGKSYPDEAWLGADGRPLPEDQTHVPKAQLQQIEAARVRTLGPVQIPPDALHKGVNVLAVEVRRSPAHPKAWKQWQPLGLIGKFITLRGEGTGVVANVSRPQGLHVWVEDINDRIGAREWADPCEPIGPMYIVGARNGSFGGIVVVSSTSALNGLKVTVSELKALKGNATIASSAVELFNAQADGRAYARQDWFDGLLPGVPENVPVAQILRYAQPPLPDAATLPVFLRVNVPKDATPGDYRGNVRVQVAGAEAVTVPLELYVSPWTAPDPLNYRTYVGLYESPTSVAMAYKVKEWSEQHWKLLEKSFALLARVGNKMVNVCVVDHTQFGNDEGMIYWIRKPDGSYDYDFTVFDRFMALAKKHLGTLDYVALQIWHSGGWDMRKADQENTVTVIDSATKERQHVQVPAFDSDEARKFWKPVLAACQEHLAKVGMDKAMCIGILSDGTAPGPVFKMFDDIWPGGGPARWTRGLHSQREDTKPYRADGKGGIVVLHEHCYGSPMLTVGDQIKGLSDLRGVPVTAYFRYSGFETYCTLNGYRLLTDDAIFLRKQGIGRIGFDFWDVIPHRGDTDDYGKSIYNLYKMSSCGQRAPALFKLSWPGPDGAETTQRYEVLCQGVRETDGMLAIEAALDHGGKLDEAATARCRKVLYDRLWFMTTRPTLSVNWATMENHVNHFGWQDLARQTFDCAAEAVNSMPKQ